MLLSCHLYEEREWEEEQAWLLWWDLSSAEDLALQWVMIRG